MAASFEAQLLCPERSLFDGRATSLSCRSSDGLLTVQAGHADLVCDVLPGIVTIEGEGQKLEVLVHGGFLQVKSAPGADSSTEGFGSKVTLLAGVAEPLGELDPVRAETAKARAEAELSQLGTTGGATEDGLDLDARRQDLTDAIVRANLRIQAGRGR